MPSSKNAVHRHYRNGKLVGKLLLGDTRFSVGVPYLAHLIVGKLSPKSPLLRHVLHVFKMRSDGKVRWVDAKRVVARVENVETVDNRPVVNDPGNTVRSFGFLRAVGSASDSKGAVAIVSRHSTNPKPAGSGLFYVLKKSVAEAHRGLIRHEVILP